MMNKDRRKKVVRSKMMKEKVERLMRMIKSTMDEVRYDVLNR
jgi:hypothetical protein